MTKVERNIIKWIEGNRNVIFFLTISVLAILVRMNGFDVISIDMKNFLLPWCNYFKETGPSGLSKQVGDYNILYQTILMVIGCTCKNPLYIIKTISVIGDILLAFFVACFICRIKGEKNLGYTFNITYSCILLLPPVVINSAYWGQCDSLYTLFLVLTVYNLYLRKTNLSFIMYGIALGFKLQAIFLLPFLIIYYLQNKEFSILKFMYSIISFWLTGIVGYCFGRNLLSAFTIYINQTDTYKKMYLNVPSIWVLFGDNYDYSKLAIVFTIFIFAIALYYMNSKKIRIDSVLNMIELIAWCVWVCVLFLPAMHERYTYSLDILLVMLAIINKKHILLAIIAIGTTIITYGKYLAGNNVMLEFCVIGYIAAFIMLSKKIFFNNQPE